MKVKYECLPCLAKQVTTLSVKLTDDKKIQEEIIQYGLDVLQKNYLNSSTLYITGLIYEFAKKITGVDDPYKFEKEKFNQIAKQLISEFNLDSLIINSANPIDTAVRLSIAGNIIDFSIGIDIDKNDVKKSIDLSLNSDFFGSSVQAFTNSIEKAKNILFIGDNSGEIVFDKLLIELLPQHKIKYVVKGGPIVNDVTLKDAHSTGMSKLVKIIDTGASVQGSELSLCSDSFLEAFRNSDLIISKGQANFESLCDVKDKEIFFLLRAKCKVIADEVGCKQHSFVLLNNNTI